MVVRENNLGCSLPGFSVKLKKPGLLNKMDIIMKNKIIVLLLIILSLFIGSCNNSTEPDDGQAILTGKIVFTSSISGETYIYTINADGTDLKQIVTASLSAFSPPNGVLMVRK